MKTQKNSKNAMLQFLQKKGYRSVTLSKMEYDGTIFKNSFSAIFNNKFVTVIREYKAGEEIDKGWDFLKKGAGSNERQNV